MEQSDPFESFPARVYLDTYYSYVGAENGAMMRALAEFVHSYEAPMKRVVEVAGGPSVVPILALCAATDRSPGSITFMDVCAKNMKEAEMWLRGRPEAFDYGDVLEWLAREHLIDEPRIECLAREAEWALPVVDLGQPIPGDMAHAFDTVSSHFFAESATNDPDTMVKLLSGIARLAAPEARVFLSFMRRSTGYRVGEMDFPAVSVDEDSLPGLLEQAGFDLRDARYIVIDAEEPPVRDGYEGMVFVGGVMQTASRLAPPRDVAPVAAEV